MQAYFTFKSKGTLWFDPQKGKRFDPWWALLITEEDIVDYYRWILKKWGIDTEPNKLWGPHISVIKGQEPADKTLWGTQFEPVEFWYTNQIRFDNDKHAWLDCFSPEMYDIRIKMGLPGKSFYHMTLGIMK